MFNNVRFFGGTRAQYDSLIEHNPLALYFCEDTQELFWGNRCISDGIRVIPTHADLPELKNAADGIVYYIKDSHNGYTVSPDRTEWLQTIYAPATDAYKIPEEEIHNTVTTVGAVRDIEKAIYSYVDAEVAKIVLPDFSKFLTEIPEEYVTDAELEAKGYLTEHQSLAGLATENFVHEMIAKAELADKEADLEAYYTKDQVDALIPDVSGFIKDVPDEYITESELDSKGYLTEHQDLSGKADKEHVHDNYADKEHEHDQYLTEHQSLAEYAKRDELFSGDYNDLANKPEIPSITGLATIDYVTEAISKVPTVDLSAYAKTDFVEHTTIAQKYEVLPVSGLLVSYRDHEVRLNTQRVTPEHQNVGTTGNPNMYYVTFRAYAPEEATGVIESDGSQTDKEPQQLSVDTFGRKYTTIWSAVASYNGSAWSKWGDMSSLDKYYGFYYTFKWFKENELIGTDKVRVILTNDECHDDLVPDAVARRIDEKVGAIKVPSIEGLATKIELEEAINNIEHPTIDLAGYATEDFVTESIRAIELPSIPTKTSELVNDSGFISEVPTEYITETELESRGYISDISGKADIDHSHDDLYDAKGAAQAVKDELLNGASEAYDTLKELGSLIKNSHDAIEALEIVAAGKADKEHTHSEYLTEHQDLSNYAKKSDIPTDYLTEIPAEYITVDELDAKGYLTEHQDLSGKADLNHIHDEYAAKEHEHDQYLTEHQPLTDYAKKEELFSRDYNDLTNKPEIPSIEGLATETYVDEKVANVSVDLTGYATEAWVEGKNYLTEHQDISGKADNVLFTTSKFVTTPIGDFKAGDDIKDLTISELFAKLLGLSDEAPATPDIPEESNGIIDNILMNEIPMYAVTADAELAEVPYKYIAFTEESALEPATESGFYQIKDASGTVIESGYQELQADSGDVYYIIALPKELDYNTMINVKAWDNMKNEWVDTGINKFDMTSDTAEVAELCDESGIDISHIDTSKYTIWVWPDTPSGSKLRYVINE